MAIPLIPKAKQLSNSMVRACQRIELLGDVLIHDEEQLYMASIGNISAGGVFVESLDAWELGTEVRVVIRSPHLNESVQAVGTVVRINRAGQKGTAVQFVTIAKKAKTVIEKCVQKHVAALSAIAA